MINGGGVYEKEYASVKSSYTFGYPDYQESDEDAPAEKPKIYLSSSMDEAQYPYVIAHEQAHLKRGDQWWKPLGFLILAIHWFHPFVWVAYLLFCNDLELACDESAVKKLNPQERKDYSYALLSCSIQRRLVTVCPLAFGEVGVKKRVKEILNYKKPTFWVVLAAVAVCVIVAV